MTESKIEETKNIEDSFYRVYDLVLSGDIENEDDLDEYVRVYTEQQRVKIKKQFAGEIKPTLLEVLGYSLDTSERQPTLTEQKGSNVWKTKPDFILRSGGKDVATLDLKSPKESLDDKNHVGQLQYYCTHKSRPVPLGILFNGHSLRIFVNVTYTGLTKFKAMFAPFLEAKEFELIQVVSIDLGREQRASLKAKKQIVDELTRLKQSELSTGAIKIASALARRKIKEFNSVGRVKAIQTSLRDALTHPTEEIVVAVASAITNWAGLDAEPSIDEVVSAWHSGVEAPLSVSKVEAAAKQSINSIVRQKVAEVCAAQGWDYLKGAKVKGLRYRYEGGNGYHPVPQTQGVPANLHVGGLSTGDAKNVIQRLEALS